MAASLSLSSTCSTGRLLSDVYALQPRREVPLVRVSSADRLSSWQLVQGKGQIGTYRLTFSHPSAHWSITSDGTLAEKRTTISSNLLLLGSQVDVMLAQTDSETSHLDRCLRQTEWLREKEKDFLSPRQATPRRASDLCVSWVARRGPKETTSTAILSYIAFHFSFHFTFASVSSKIARAAEHSDFFRYIVSLLDRRKCRSAALIKEDSGKRD